jgi:glycerol-3-phosphate acyltransferase PlsY
LWELWWCLKERTTRAVSTTFSAFTTLATWLVTISTLTARLVTVTTRSSALITIAATLLAKLLCYCFERLIRRKNFKESGTGCLLLRCSDGEHTCAVQVGFHFSANNVLHCGA